MKILVLGANGKVGSKLVDQLLDAGHTVRGFVHNASRLPDHPHLEIYSGDIYSDEDVKNSLKSCDAVVSALGSWGTKRKDVLSEAMKRMVPAMRDQGVKRIVSLTGAGAFAPDDHPRTLDKLNRKLLMLVAPKILLDGETHINLLHDSGLDWTVVRSPIMFEKGRKGFSLSMNPPAPIATINRQDVAIALKDLIETNSHLQQSPFIKRA